MVKHDRRRATRRRVNQHGRESNLPEMKAESLDRAPLQLETMNDKKHISGTVEEVRTGMETVRIRALEVQLQEKDEEIARMKKDHVAQLERQEENWKREAKRIESLVPSERTLDERAEEVVEAAVEVVREIKEENPTMEIPDTSSFAITFQTLLRAALPFYNDRWENNPNPDKWPEGNWKSPNGIKMTYTKEGDDVSKR